MSNLLTAYKAVESTKSLRDSLVQQRAVITSQIDVVEEDLVRMRSAADEARAALADLLSKER
jgi:hypothetical protein